jgi:hypothetical protein
LLMMTTIAASHTRQQIVSVLFFVLACPEHVRRIRLSLVVRTNALCLDGASVGARLGFGNPGDPVT